MRSALAICCATPPGPSSVQAATKILSVTAADIGLSTAAINAAATSSGLSLARFFSSSSSPPSAHSRIALLAVAAHSSKGGHST
jgi:hypothetical protein